MKHQILTASILFFGLAAGPANAVHHETSDAAADTGNIIEVAQAAGSFDTLLTALDAAGLTETLAQGGPFTVFAPTDEAFAALPEGALEGLLADPDKLTAVLTYHVVDGANPASAVTGLSSVETLQGGALSVSTEDGVKIGDATVVKADIDASNGVIHVIDQVLLP